MNQRILDEIASLGITDFQPTNDTAQGRISHKYSSSNYTAFQEVTAVRIGDNWDVVGTAIHVNPNSVPRTQPFSVSVDTTNNAVALTIGTIGWSFPVTGGPVRVVNSADTGDLLLSVTQAFNSSTPAGSGYTMYAGSFLAVKDA